MQLTLISREGCSYCTKAKNALKERSIEFTEKEIGKDITREEVLTQYPEAKNLPIFLKNDRYVGGYTELVDHIVEIMENRHDIHKESVAAISIQGQA